ncbi:MAG: aldo/keto reductase [Prevotella sp.]|nr:aldo/keto reductase [Prevotella sp.]
MAKDINRRDFLKLLGSGVVGSSALLAACTGRSQRPTTAVAQEPPTDKMTMRTNHNSGDRVSLLGYGMMRLPVVGGGTERDHPDADIDQEMVNRQVDYALAHGVNYFDTSPVYCQGRSEKATGKALSRHPRGSYYVATKLSNFATQLQTRQASQQMFEQSLRLLQVEYIDYLLLHSIGGGNDALETFNRRFMDNGILDWLVEQKRRGRIRNLGFSYHGDVAIFDMLLRWHDEGRYHWDFCQVELNYLDWEWAKEINPRNTNASYLYAELVRRNIPVVVMEPLLGGRLANVPNPVTMEMKRRRPENSVASWAFRYAGTPAGVLTVLSGMTYMEHLRDNIATYAPLVPLTDDENRFLLRVAEDIYNQKNIPCSECNYCMPCPYGIDIPAIFAHYNKMIREGTLPGDSQDPRYRSRRRAYLVGYDRSVPRLRQASHCIGCGQCVPACPQRINIPHEMQRLDQLTERLKQDVGGLM